MANPSPTHPSLGKDAHRVLNAADTDPRTVEAGSVTRSLELQIARWVNEGGAGGDEDRTEPVEIGKHLLCLRHHGFDPVRYLEHLHGAGIAR